MKHESYPKSSGRHFHTLSVELLEHCVLVRTQTFPAVIARTSRYCLVAKFLSFSVDVPRSFKNLLLKILFFFFFVEKLLCALLMVLSLCLFASVCLLRLFLHKYLQLRYISVRPIIYFSIQIVEVITQISPMVS